MRSQQSQGTPKIQPTTGSDSGQSISGYQHQLPPTPPSSAQTLSTSWRCLQHGEPYRLTHTPPSSRKMFLHLPLSAGTAALPGFPAGCHVAPEPRCRSLWHSVSFRVAHLKFQLAGCFGAGGMQNQPTNTNKYLLYSPPAAPPPPLILVFILTSQLVLGGENGFSKLSVNVCNNRKRCLLACGRHSFK